MIIILTALKQEKNALIANAKIRKCVDNGIVQCFVTGMGKKTLDFLEKHSNILFSSGLVINTGICGALNDRFRLFDPVFPEFVSSIEIKNELIVPEGKSGHLITVDTPILGKENKVSLDGDFVDMEACHIAEFCTKYGIPFRIVKVISDTPETSDDSSAHLRQAKQALHHLAGHVNRCFENMLS